MTWGEMLAAALSTAQGDNPTRAGPLVKQLLTLRPGNADALTVAGILAQRTGRMHEALGAFRAARDAAPADAGKHQNLGVALKNAGAFEEALEAFGAALALRPGHPATLGNLGSCLIAAGRFEEALQTLALAGENPDALNNRGVALSRLGRHEDAIAAYRRSLSLRDGHLETALNLVDALTRTGCRAEARALASQLQRAQPQHARVANQVGLLHEHAGDFADAAAAFSAAFDPTKPNHALGVNLARVLIRLDRAEEALSICDALIATQPSITTPLALAVAASEKLGDTARRDALMGLNRFVTMHEIATPSDFSSLEQFNTALVAELREHSSLTYEPEGLVTRQGMQSGDLADARSPGLQALSALAHTQLAQARGHFAAQLADHPFLRALPLQWSLTLWGTILQPGGKVTSHIHAPNWLSGVYYPEFEGEDGQFAIGLLPEELGGGGTPVIRQPRAGRMILFPSYLWHATLPFGGTRERISFAFDLVPEGVGRAHRLR
jgi:Flp pilus assembly protein TadD